MPLYEYVCDQDPSIRLELLRPIARADDPVDDPDHPGRTFSRVHSTFATAGPAAGTGAARSVPLGSCCPCGKSAGSCSRN